MGAWRAYGLHRRRFAIAHLDRMTQPANDRRDHPPDDGDADDEHNGQAPEEEPVLELHRDPDRQPEEESTARQSDGIV